MEIKTILFWVLVLAFIVSSAFFGFLKLKGEKKVIENFIRWGYPVWFMKVIGSIEIIVPIGLAFQQTRLLCVGLLAILLSGALYTQIIHKGSRNDIMTVVGVLIHLAVIFAMAVWVV